MYEILDDQYITKYSKFSTISNWAFCIYFTRVIPFFTTHHVNWNKITTYSIDQCRSLNSIILALYLVDSITWVQINFWNWSIRPFWAARYDKPRQVTPLSTLICITYSRLRWWVHRKGTSGSMMMDLANRGNKFGQCLRWCGILTSNSFRNCGVHSQRLQHTIGSH